MGLGEKTASRSLISQATPFADRSVEERKIVGRLCLSHCSQPSHIMLQHFTRLCMCVPWAFAEHWPYLATPSKPW